MHLKAIRLFSLSVLVGAILTNVGCQAVSHYKDARGVQAAQRLETVISLEVNLDYLIHLPEGYGVSDQEWPLMLFLHGAGERGDDVSRLAVNGPPMLIETGEWDFPGIVVSPQCPKGHWWSAPEELLALEALLDSIEAQYRVDSTRVYLTGLSMGGFGSWALAAHAPDRFAAVAPICGGGDPLMAHKLKEMPIWVFHGARDNVIPVERSEQMVDALKSKGAAPRFTIYPEEGHGSWVPAYQDPELYRWFLLQSLDD